MSAFKIGDVVILKSGGPWMTVTSIPATPGFVGVTWFDAAEDEREDRLGLWETGRDIFPQDALELVTEDNNE